MVMKTSNRWRGLLVTVVTVSYASAFSSSGCRDQQIGDGYCDDQNNNPECQYDGGDCCECTCVDGGQWSDDYVCGQWTGFACIDPSAPCVDDDDITAEMVEQCEYPNQIGDGRCQQGNNKEICGYDGGDCCECTCTAPIREGIDPSMSFCGDRGQYTEFACIDPEAPCVDDDDVTAVIVENCDYLGSIGDGYCHPQNNKPECDFDGGDCCSCTCDNPSNNEYMCSDFACVDPSAPCVDDDDVTVEIVENCPEPERIGNGLCDDGNNKEECGYDGGDCCSCTCVGQCSAFACVDPSASCVDDDDVTVDMIGRCNALGIRDGWCNMENNNAECAYDGGDCCECTCGTWADSDGNCNKYNTFACVDPAAPCVDDDSFTVDMIEDCVWPSRFGDGRCDADNNTPECAYDGGDCCECTCTSDDDTYSCQQFACIDPSAPCVDDDDITEDMFENCRYPPGIGNGYCENGNNKAECNWDGGDCCSCDCEVPECENQYNTFDCKNPASMCFGEYCKNPASTCFGEYIEPQSYDMSYEFS